MTKKFELSVGDYGRRLFQIMTDDNSHVDHWESIREKAEPLVRQLIALNSEMKGGGYKITGYKTGRGKKILSNEQRIELAQRNHLGIEIGKCKEGDYVWLIDNFELSMPPNECDPVMVDGLYKNSVMVQHPRLRDALFEVDVNEIVIRSPDGCTTLTYTDEYWLSKADELGI